MLRLKTGHVKYDLLVYVLPKRAARFEYPLKIPTKVKVGQEMKFAFK